MRWSWQWKAASSEGLCRGNWSLRAGVTHRMGKDRVKRGIGYAREQRGNVARKIELAPSILSANFANLAADAKLALEGGGTLLHVDVMDGHFVPNITLGPPVVASLRKAIPDAIFDVHLMIENPDEFIPGFAEAGATWILVHQEACRHLDRTLHLIEDHGCKPGVVINPATPVSVLDDVLD